MLNTRSRSANFVTEYLLPSGRRVVVCTVRGAWVRFPGGGHSNVAPPDTSLPTRVPAPKALPSVSRTTRARPASPILFFGRT